LGKLEYLDYSHLHARPPPHPATWVSGYAFDLLAQSVMHNLCLLHVAKNVLKKVFKLLKLFGLYEKFKKFAHEATTKLKNVKVD
jgi:hypothetical protein